MSELRFDGKLCGLNGRSTSGDANDATNYMVMCQCGAPLGNLRKFLAFKVKDPSGNHHVGCPGCKFITTISSGGVILKCIHGSEHLASLATQELMRSIEQKV